MGRPARLPVAVIGGGVVGCAVLHALARHGVACTLLEGEPGLCLGASGANSGILHTGFDSAPGELETRLILRAAALREELREELGLQIEPCGARMSPADPGEHEAIAAIAANARANGVATRLEGDGTLHVPGEAITDPVAFAHALAGAAEAGGGRVRLASRVCGLAPGSGETLQVRVARGKSVSAGAVVNCAGLFADEVAALTGERRFQVYPRKGEFLVFDQPVGAPLREILLPVPGRLGKGVLVFPAPDSALIAGPTARERQDKDDWSVEQDAGERILPLARRMYPPLADARAVESYAGLRPAGRDANYVIEPSTELAGVLHVAAIRSTGLSASLGIAEHVVSLLAGMGVIEPGAARILRPPGREGVAAAGRAALARRWWRRGAEHHARRARRPPEHAGAG